MKQYNLGQLKTLKVDEEVYIKINKKAIDKELKQQTDVAESLENHKELNNGTAIVLENDVSHITIKLNDSIFNLNYWSNYFFKSDGSIKIYNAREYVNFYNPRPLSKYKFINCHDKHKGK